jgi:CheY-like chemotaxis protein
MSAKRALIVDDSRSARTFLTRILERYDLQVDGAGSAEEAIKYLLNQHPDVIFMDHLMPGMDGFQALSAIKNDPRTAAIPVMMYTSQEGELYLEQARALGAVGVLPKQTRPGDVSRALEQLRLLGEPDAERLARAASAVPATQAPAAAGAAGAAGALSTPAAGSAATVAGLSPELRAQLDALLRDHGIELRRFVAATLAEHTGQIISEVRALMDGAAVPPAAAEPAAEPAPPQAPRRPLSGGRAVLWLAVVAALIAAAAGLLWYQAARREMQHANPRVARAVSVAPAAAPASAPSMVSAAAPVPAATSAPLAASPTVTAAAVSAIAPAPAAPAATVVHEDTVLVETVPFGEAPLGGARLEPLRLLLARLSAAGFRGVVEIESYPGRYCMQGGPGAQQLPAGDVAYSACSMIGNPLDYAEPAKLQSPEFARLLAAQAGRGRGSPEVQLVTGSADEVMTPYPAISTPLTAGEWNRAAAANNRVEVHTRPLP